MQYLSTFSGIGGFELGIHAAIDGAECIGYSEVDKYAIETYESHYEHHNYGDITAINAAGLPGFDLIVGGFPCQAFSVAGKRRGFDETRGTLFFDVARILADKRPRHLVLENVKGLLNHDDGKTFAVILGVLADLGYRVEWQVFNSKHFGVPQSRERIYIIGHLRDQCSRNILPITRNKRQAVEASEHEPRGSEKFIKTRHLSQNGGLVSDSITLQASETPHIVQVGSIWGGQSGRIYETHGVSPTLSTMTGGGHKQPKILQRPRGKNMGGIKDIAPTVSSSKYQDNNMVVSVARRGRGDGSQLELRDDDIAGTVRTPGGGSSTPHVLDTTTAYALKASDYKKTGSDFITKSNGNFGVIDGVIRRLTPVECERLQGFPDNWTLGSDTQRYKQCGNAVTVNVVEAIMHNLKECLL